MAGVRIPNGIDIKGYEGLYQITPDLDIWSVRKGLIISPVYLSGKPHAHLYKNGKRKVFRYSEIMLNHLDIRNVEILHRILLKFL